MTEENKYYPVQDHWSLVWLVVATLLSVVSMATGRWVIGVTVWLAGIFYIRFFRSQKKVWLAYLLTAISVSIVTVIIIPSMMGPMAIPIIVGAALLGPLPLLIDRWMSRRLPGFASTLVFPIATTAFDFINIATNPFGSYGATLQLTRNMIIWSCSSWFH